MTWTKDPRNAGIVKVAQQAAAEPGRSTFVAHLVPSPTQHKVHSSMEQWAEAIDAIAANGWALQHFAVHNGPKGDAEAYCLFTRR